LRLFRVPNVFTAIADTSMAFAVASVDSPNIAAFILLVVATSLLYTSGMVLNDTFDFEQDLKERPQRPLPAGRIDRQTAKQLGLSMLGTGCVAAPIAIWLQGGNVVGAAVLVGCLAAAIYSYNAGGKRTVFGPYIMGSCRMFNILFVLCASRDFGFLSEHAMAVDQLMIAGGIGVYIAGITWFARTEAARSSHRGRLSFALLHMLLGIAMLMFFPEWNQSGRTWHLPSESHFFLLIMILAIPVVRRAAIAIANPAPRRVQAVIKQGIFSLIVFDAGITLMVAPVYWAVAVLLLLLPTVTLGAWIYST
jgi:4-hydroxybenzoate polyprenyltransferase